MEETLTQKSRRRGDGELYITMCKVAIIKACHLSYWKGGAFSGIKYYSSDVDIDLERLEESKRITEAERAVFRDTRSRIKDVRAYLEGRPVTDMSSLEDVGWVRRLQGVFEGQVGEGQEAKEASAIRKAETKMNPSSSEEDEGDGFKTQKVYGGSGGPPELDVEIGQFCSWDPGRQ